MYYIGTDIIEIARIRTALDRWGKKLLSRIYTDAEVIQCGMRSSSLAAHFAGKEAVIKALGATSGVSWKEIEIVSSSRGRPSVRLSGGARGEADRLGINAFSVSLSHSQEYAIAFVIGEPKSKRS